MYPHLPESHQRSLRTVCGWLWQASLRNRASRADKNIYINGKKRFWEMRRGRNNSGGIKIVKNGVDGAELWQSCFTVFPSSQLSFLSHPHFTPDVSLTQKFKSPQFPKQYRLHGGMFWCGDHSLHFHSSPSVWKRYGKMGPVCSALAINIPHKPSHYRLRASKKKWVTLLGFLLLSLCPTPLPQPQPCLSLPAWDASVGGRQSWSEEAEQFLHIIFTTIYSWAFDSRKYNPQQLVT